MKQTRRKFLQTAGAAGMAAALGNGITPARTIKSDQGARRFHFVQMDVFTLRKLEGNPLAVFPDARFERFGNAGPGERDESSRDDVGLPSGRRD